MAWSFNPFTCNLDLTGASAGNVVGPPGGSTDNAVPRFDGTTGTQLQDSGVTIDDTDNMDVPGNVVVHGQVEVDGFVKTIEIVDSGLNSTIDVENKILLNSGSVPIINWETGIINDSSSVVSIELFNRTLKDEVGATVAAWAATGLSLPTETANTVPVLDANKAIKSSSVTSTELGYISGVTSSVQTQLNNKASTTLNNLGSTAINASLLPGSSGTIDLGSGASEWRELHSQTADFTSGITTVGLDATGTVTLASLDMQGAVITNVDDPVNPADAANRHYVDLSIAAIPAPIIYKGVYNATTNVPALANTDVAKTGFLYYVTTAGTQNFGAGPITFAVGDKVVNNGTTWDKWDNTDEVISVNGQTGAVVLTTSDITEGTNLYFNDERAQDAVGTILVDTASVDLTYSDGTPSITATVLPAGVNHNALQNYVANEHIDHTTVQIATASSTSGLTGGGTIAATRNLSVDIPGTTAETVPADADQLLIYDASATALKSMTRANFLTGIAPSSTGDIAETSFSAANNQAAAANITGLAFANATVRSFQAILSVALDATSDLFAQYTLNGIQKGASWEMSQSFVGDATGMVFSITSAGQVQYTSANSAGFVSNTLKFRAQVTGV